MSENDWLEESTKPISPAQYVYAEALKHVFARMLAEKNYDPVWVDWNPREWGAPPLPPETPVLCRIDGNDDDTVYGAVGEIQWAHTSIDRIRIVPNHRFGDWHENDGSGDMPENGNDDDPWVHVQTNEGWGVDTCSTYYWFMDDKEEEGYVKHYRVLERPFGEDEEESEVTSEEQAFIEEHAIPLGDVRWSPALKIGEYLPPINSDCYVTIFMENAQTNDGRVGGFWWGVKHRGESDEILSYSVDKWVINPEEEFDNPGTQPVPNGTRVQVLLRHYDGTWEASNNEPAEKYDWSIDGDDGDIMKYRILAEPGA